jgi:hypothetical protein
MPAGFIPLAIPRASAWQRFAAVIDYRRRLPLSAENPKRRDRQCAIKRLLTATRNLVSICDE